MYMYSACLYVEDVSKAVSHLATLHAPRAAMQITNVDLMRGSK